MHKLLVNRSLKPAQEKVWLSELAIAVDMGRKATKTTNKHLSPSIYPRRRVKITSDESVITGRT